jgi:hypothetical protein
MGEFLQLEGQVCHHHYFQHHQLQIRCFLVAPWVAVQRSYRLEDRWTCRHPRPEEIHLGRGVHLCRYHMTRMNDHRKPKICRLWLRIRAANKRRIRIVVAGHFGRAGDRGW